MTVISAAHIAGTGKSASTNRSAWAPNLLRCPAAGLSWRPRSSPKPPASAGPRAKPPLPVRMGSTSARWRRATSRSLRHRARTATFSFQLRGPRGRRHAGKSVVVARRGRSFFAQRRPSSVWGADSRAAHCCHDYEGPTLLPSHCGSCGRALVVIGPAHMVGAAGPMNCPGLARLLLHRECGDRARQPLPGSLQCCSYR